MSFVSIPIVKDPEADTSSLIQEVSDHTSTVLTFLPSFIPVEDILLGFQHYLIMLSTIVIIPTALVPQMGGGNEEKAQVIQTSLFVAGLNTLLRSFFGTRLPAVIGGSYTYVAPTISIILSGQWNDEDPVRWDVGTPVGVGLRFDFKPKAMNLVATCNR
ncbi:hypothetical protein FXO38_28780 [Capsicum annuum]|nr:hypothetical protein FXO38_28780 [Capsicum annuum]KAF3662042.1 hypothetical protein FXO37_12629 [Capsicum annuum]